MNANELANKSFMELWDSYTSKKMECEDLHEKICQQQERILELEGCINDCYTVQKMQADECYKVQAENDAFRKELFKIGSMRSCSQAAALHGFVSPAQAGDDAREYIAELLRKAQEK